MSREDREARRRRARQLAGGPPTGIGPAAPLAERPTADRPPDGGTPSLRDRLATVTVPALALLPVRGFFGLTFLYAGLDKLVSPSFFDAASPASIQAQLAAFERVSPLAPLVRLGEPVAVPIGVFIALLEIAIGLGALTGLAYRLAAAAGAALSLLFWLTASWATHPYYYSPDLPYAFGWIALAVAGDGGLLVPLAVRRLGRGARQPTRPWSPGTRASLAARDRLSSTERPDSPARRTFLQAGVLGALAILVASVAIPLRLVRPAGAGGEGAGGGALGGGNAPGGSPRPGSTPSPSVPAGGITVAKVADVERTGAALFRIPATAPAPLPAGDPGIIVRLPDGTFVAYDALCTHEGCRVGWDAQDGVILCPCHGAAFDAANHAAVLAGPTNVPLQELPVEVDPASGTIRLRA